MKKRVYIYVVLSMVLLFACAPAGKGSSSSSKGEMFENYVNGQLTPTKIVIWGPEDNLKEYTSEDDILAILNRLKRESFKKKTKPLGSTGHDYCLEIYDQEEMAVIISPYDGESPDGNYYCVLHVEPPFQAEKYKEDEQSLKEGEEIIYIIDKKLDSYIRELFQAENGK